MGHRLVSFIKILGAVSLIAAALFAAGCNVEFSGYVGETKTPGFGSLLSLIAFVVCILVAKMRSDGVNGCGGQPQDVR